MTAFVDTQEGNRIGGSVAYPSESMTISPPTGGNIGGGGIGGGGIGGGTTAIPEAVRAAIAAAAPGATVERVDGATRTHTAANAAQRTLPSP